MPIVAPVSTPQPIIVQSISPATKCWRLIYDNAKKVVVSLFESTGEMKTNKSLFISTQEGLAGQQECLDFVKAQGLILMILPPNARFTQQSPVSHKVPNVPANSIPQLVKK